MDHPVPGPFKPVAKSLILIVDDVPENLQVLAGHLSGAGYEVMPATSGPKALLFARARPPDLVLLDVSMPEMDGYEVCRCLKNLPDLASIPVLFITARTAAEDVVRGFDAGGVDYLSKPFNSAELLARVRTHLELKAARDALLKYNAELRRLDQEKNGLLSIVSHDMRGSFANVVNLCNTLLDPTDDISREDSEELLTLVAQEAQHMILLGQNLLNADVIERGALNLKPQEVNLGEILTFLAGKHRRAAGLKGINVFVYPPAPDATTLMADRTALVQVLDNLVSNAVKFTPHGTEVSLEARRVPLHPLVRLSVLDQGPGLSVTDQGKLFGEYAPLSARPTGREHSLGLGLAIVKRVTEAMGGRAAYEPGPGGRGSRFFVELPG